MFPSSYDIYQNGSENRRNTTANTPQPDFNLDFVDERNTESLLADTLNLDLGQSGNLQQNELGPVEGLHQTRSRQRHSSQNMNQGMSNNYGNSGLPSGEIWPLYDIPSTTSGTIQAPVPSYGISQVASNHRASPNTLANVHGRLLRSRRSSLLAGLPENSMGPENSNQFMSFASESTQQKQNLLQHPAHDLGRTMHSSNQRNSLRQSHQSEVYATTQVPLDYDASANHGTASAPPQLSPNDLTYRNSIATTDDSQANRMVLNPGNRSTSHSAVLSRQPHMSNGFHTQQQHIVNESLYMESSPEVEKEDPVVARRKKYKPKSSIPPDLSSANYADQCSKAAIGCRLPPYSLHIDEYNLLRSHLSYIHVTTYLNIRNGILRLWLSNPIVNVTMAEAAGCAREERFYALAEIAYAFLIRHGYINFGCVEYTTRKYTFTFTPGEHKKPRLTIAVIGAGIAGLGCARQLENLFRRYSSHFAEYENIPRILVLEGRRRIGGRVYSATLRSETSSMVDVGGQLIMGFGNGNPLAVLVRRQLGLPVDAIEGRRSLYDEVTGKEVSEEAQNRANALYKHIVQRVSEFKNTLPQPSTIYGDKALMKAAKDPKITSGNGPRSEEYLSIAQLEEGEELPKAYEDPGAMDEQYDDNKEAMEETKFLAKIGFKMKKNKKSAIHVAPEPQGEMHPGLGQTMNGVVEQFSKIAELTPEDIRLLNFHYANLEYTTGAKLENTSLGNWDTSEGYEFTGKDCMIRNGYMSVPKGLYVYPEKLDVRFKAAAKVIEYGEDESQVILENGDRIHCDRVVLTVPLGVLKDRAIQCIPDLPQWKTDSIERLGYGTTNKVVLVYDEVFWDDSKDMICICRATDGQSMKQEDYEAIRGNCFLFWNCTKSTGRPVVVGILAGEAAVQIANEMDDMVVERAKDIFERAVNLTNATPILVESIVTRWQTDPFSRGAYSYVGREATAADYDLLARPVNNLFFAGEATCRHFPGTVHGAYLSGLRVANEVLASFTGEIEIPYPLIPPKSSSSHFHSGSNTQATGTPAPQGQIVTGMKRPASRAGGGRLNITQPSSSHDMGSGPTNGGYFEHIPGTNDLYREVGSNSTRMVGSAVEIKIKEWKEKLKELRDERVSDDNERMRHDLIKEIGERPVKPERSGANPFLIFQKDFWDKCREETDLAKQKSTADPKARATRNEVRAALGKMWREFPEDEKAPYLSETKSKKEENLKKADTFRKKIRQYDSEAEDFRRRWRDENASGPSDEELQLIDFIHEAGGNTDDDRRPKRSRRG